MYRLMTETIAPTTPDADVVVPERLRQKLLASTDLLVVNDLGGGSKNTPEINRRVALLAKHSARRPRPGKLLYRLVKHFNPATVLELGTSLGVGTLYLKAAAPSARVVTIEGCAHTARLAQRNIRESGASDVEVIVGSFDAVLTSAFVGSLLPDLVVFDGDHRKEPTLAYFSRLAEVATGSTVFVFDDIHWSKGMEEAWQEIKADQRVRVTIDLFTFGVVLFRPAMSRQHFVLRNWDCF